jgi:hypothetical protein
MNRLTELQISSNAESRDGWEVFRAHRARVTGLLRIPLAPGQSRLCVLGAGNCNDLALAALLAAYRELHLVDLDGEALTRGVARQGVLDHPAVHCHGGLDVTGVVDVLAAWSGQTPILDEELAACAAAPLQRVRPALPGPFDVVASTGLLSQLIHGIVGTAGEAHPRFLQALQAVRAGHLRLLADLVAPGGVGVLVCDVVSSESFPGLASTAEEWLPALLADLIRQRNFFHGINPAVVAEFLRADPVVGPQVAALEYVRPWLWDLGPRVYLVYALRFQKHPGPASP